MGYMIFALALGFGLFGGMVVMLLIGRRIGRARLQQDPEASAAGLGVIDAAIFALFGLLIAFTFSNAGGRFDERRQLIVQEANIIGTAWLRLDLLPPESQPELRQLFRDYTTSRVELAKAIYDDEQFSQISAQSQALLNRIWAGAVAAVQKPGVPPSTTTLVIPALNEMIDITTTRVMTAERHPPMAIWVIFYALALMAALFAGQGMASSKKASLLHVVGFPALVALVVSLVINLEHPRLGLISMGRFDQAIVDVRRSMD